MGPITPLDRLHGHNAFLARGNGFMRHRGGFTARSLEAALLAAGFPVAWDSGFAPWATAYRGAVTAAA